jgi:hypothetical protein
MIKLDSLGSGGKQIIYRHKISGGTWDYGSFEEIVTDNAAPPSKIFPTDDAAAGGIFDHVFMTSSMGNGDTSMDVLRIGSAFPIWTSLGNVVNSIKGWESSITYIYLAVTEIEYVGFNQSNFKSYYHLGFDVYVTV